MRILHTEASPGWGGQEMRILAEAQGMRERGHEIVLCVQQGGGLVVPARAAGFLVYEMCFSKKKGMRACFHLIKILRKHRIEVVNTHSSLDAWIGGIAARLAGCHLLRTRHLSTPIRAGINSYVLYNLLADTVVTTCADIVPILQKQAFLSAQRCRSIPTGLVPFTVTASQREAFRQQWGIAPTDFVVGTLCVLRGWKGIADLLEAAHLLRALPHLKWLVVGTGPSERYFKDYAERLDLGQRVIFTGHQAPAHAALASFDAFALLSYAHEGVSQASLQAAWLAKPLITTPTGGLKEVCIDRVTGLLVPSQSPQEVSEAVQCLMQNVELRVQYGLCAQHLVTKHFMADHMLASMEHILQQL